MRQFLCVAVIVAALTAGGAQAGLEGTFGNRGEDVPRTTFSTTVDAGTDRSVFVGQPVTLSADAAPGSSSVLLWDDLFDAYPTGPLSAPWSDQSTGLNFAEVSSTVFHGGGGKSLHLYDNSLVDGANAYRTLPDPAQVDLTVWMLATTTSGAGTIVLNSPSAWATVRAGMGPDGLFIYGVCSASYSSTAMPYTAGTWYEVRLVADAATDRYDMYVDGSRVVAGAAFCTGAGWLDGVVLNSGGDQLGEFYFDDVRTLTPQPNQIVEYRWDLDGSVDGDLDGNNTNDTDMSGPTVTTTYSVPAVYLATVTVLDSTLSFANDSVWVTVRVPPSSSTSVNAGTDVFVAEGQTFLLAPTIVPGSAWQELWNDSFDTYSPGPLVSPWADRSTGPNSASVSSSVRRGPSGNSVLLDDSSVADGANAERRWAGAPTALDVTAWIYPTSTSALGTVVISSDSLWGAVRAGVGPGGTFVYDVCGPTYTSLPKPYSSAVWYEVRMVADVSNDRYDLYINGSLAVSQAPFCGPVNSLDYVWLNAGGNSVGDFHMDDLTVWGRVAQQVTSYSWDLDGASDTDSDGNATNDPDVAGAAPIATLGDNGDYLVTVTVTLSGGSVYNDSFRASVANLAPAVTPILPGVVSITTGVQAVARISDPGSDDLRIEWSWTDGAFDSRDYLNGGGADPPQSPQGVFPFFVNDTSNRGFPSPGAYGLSIRVDDDDGGSAWGNRTVDVRDVPFTVATMGQPRYAGGRTYINASTPITLSATDRSGLGIDATFYRIDGGAAMTYVGPFKIGTAGLRNITYWSTDLLGGIEAPRFMEVYVDVSPPVTVLEIQGPFLIIGPTEWITPATAIWVNATDSESGLRDKLVRTRVGAVWFPWLPVLGPLSAPVAEGPFGMEYYSVDNLGQPSPVDSASFSVDGTPPVSSIAIGVPASGGWVTSATPLSLLASDAGTGVSAIRYRVWHSGAWSAFIAYTVPFTFSAGEGLYYVEFYSEDRIGNSEVVRNASLSVDDSPPITSVEIAGAHVQVLGTLWVVPSVGIWVNATDAGAGWNVTFHRFWTGTSWTPWTLVTGVLAPPLAEGLFRMEFYSGDRLGHSEAARSLALAVDGAPPVSVAVSGAPAAGLWVTSATPIAIEASDGSGVGIAVTRFRTWHAGVYSPFTPYASPFRLLEGEGTTIVESESEDLLGNRESVQSSRFDVDDTPPEIEYRVHQSTTAYEFSVEASANDSGSGLASFEYRIGDGDWQDYAGGFTVRGKSPVSIEFRATDLLGNVGVAALPTTRPGYVNLKPLLSILLAVTILVCALFLYRRGTRVKKVLLLGAVFTVAELLCGVASMLWDVLLFPPWTGAGLAVNLGITVAGVAGAVMARRYWTGTSKTGSGGSESSDRERESPPTPPAA